MSSPNAGFLFNKTSFQKLHISDKEAKNLHVKSINKLLCSLALDAPVSQLLNIKSELDAVVSFPLITNWPGLILGVGYGHATGSSDEEFKVGFYFDFTTGLPVIPGSYVKGKLRSFFPDRYKNNPEKKQLVLKQLIQIFKDINIYPQKLNTNSLETEWKAAIRKIEDYIFEGRDNDGNRINPLKQDTFLEAYISKGTNGNIVTGNRPEEKQNIFLSEDTVTPHKHPLKDPLPLRFLKVLPGVEFTFQFIFIDDKILRASQKEKLFKHLLQEHGIGAKTSNGFGKFQKQFADVSTSGYITFTAFRKKERDHEEFDEGDDDEKELWYQPRNPTAPAPQTKQIAEQPNWADPVAIKPGSKVQATVLSYSNGSATLRLHIKQFKLEKKKNMAKPESDISEVVISNVLGNLAKGKFDVELKK